MAISKSVFFKFTVKLPEKGDVQGMKDLLDAYPDDRDTLLSAEKTGSDGGRYSVLGYTTFLCMCGGDWEIRAEPVLQWLLELGVVRDIWVDVALKNHGAFVERLGKDPSLANAKHSVWGYRILEMVPESWQSDLIEAGARIDDVYSAILLNDISRVKAMVQADRTGIFAASDHLGFSVLEVAIIKQRDSLACWLIDQGIPVSVGTKAKIGALELSCCWGCLATLKKMIAGGADPHTQVTGRSLKSYAEGAAVKNQALMDYLESICD